MDVKPSNILLDSNMNPKITDFNISMVLHDGDDEITGDDILGTLGYIPPECFENSIISMMNDVYAFGVTVINTISVMCRNIQPCERLLCTWAWDAWEAGQMEDVFDPKLYEGSPLREIKRCVKVGLLCLQSDRADRPTMADVLEMIHGKKRLPTLKKPAYMESESESEIESITEGSCNRWNRTRNRKSLHMVGHRRR
ncbi:hypothetical protein C2845_PM17G14600 [Panicum miliaceum]|uniref:Protein kinase domain-containing protein n=1 Tax=Panicum miliaceum TaxID=4540 RepID=A0A3L6PZM0_PANMI|nr:hypothetical protein C2845_PM17G14600 [Panicum miliaceum]